MQIEGLSIDNGTDTISWFLEGKLIKVICKSVRQALVFPKVQSVFVLVGSEDYDWTLIGFTVDGKKKFEVKAPEGYDFSYLTIHPTTDVAVVCNGNNYVDGWRDWHFSVEPSTGDLTRHCPAY